MSKNYLSYFFIFFANIFCWLGTLQILGFFTYPTVPTYQVLSFTISAVLFSIVSGRIVDSSFTKRKFILIGFFLYIIGFILSFFMISYDFRLFGVNFDSYFIGVFLGGVFGVNSIPIGAYFADISNPKERGKLQGVSYCLSIGFGFFLILLFATPDMKTNIFIVFPLIIVIAISLVIFNVLYKKSSLSEPSTQSSESTSFSDVLKHKHFIYFVISFLLFMIALPFIQVFFDEANILIPSDFIFINRFIYYPLLSIFALMGGFWADRSRKSLILISFLILGFGFTIWGVAEPIATEVPTLIIILVLVTFGNAVTNVTDYIIPADYSLPRSRGKYIAVFFAATNIGLIISILLRPIITDPIHPLPTPIIGLIVTALLLSAISPIILTSEPLEEALAKEVDVKGIYVITQDGRCLFEMSFKDVLIDVDLITSALSAVGSLIKESIHSEKKLKSIDHGDVKIMVEYGTYVNSAVIADKETGDVRDRLERFLKEFEYNYQEYLSHWIGDVRPFFEAYKLIESYFGLYLAKK